MNPQRTQDYLRDYISHLASESSGIALEEPESVAAERNSSGRLAWSQRSRWWMARWKDGCHHDMTTSTTWTTDALLPALQRGYVVTLLRNCRTLWNIAVGEAASADTRWFYYWRRLIYFLNEVCLNEYRPLLCRVAQLLRQMFVSLQSSVMVIGTVLLCRASP